MPYDIGQTGIIESTDEHIADILKAHKGGFKFSPLSGVGIDDALNGNNLDIIKVEAKKQLKAEGITNYNVLINNEKL
jgi:hypothetical protein